MGRKTRVVRHVIGLHVGSRSLAPRTRAELRGLGYELVPASDGRRADAGDRAVSLRVVDERHLDRVPTPAEEPETPLVVLTGSRPLLVDDPRIAGRVRRPADTLDLYPLFQRALEVHPRRVPRVTTQLPARCIRADRRWPGAVLSLSEGGCLLRTTETVEAGQRFNLQFAIPGGELINARVSCVYGGDQRAGLMFSEPSPVDRDSIRGYVSQRLALL